MEKRERAGGIAGSSHRDRTGFEKEFEKIAQALRETRRARRIINKERADHDQRQDVQRRDFFISGLHGALFQFLAFRSDQLGKVATGPSWVTLLIHTAAILLRWVESYQLGIGHAPLSNMYESLVFFSWCIALLYLLWERKMKSRIIGAFAMPFAFVFIAYASLAPGVSARIDPLIPALQSNWLHAHVITCFLSYAAFALSCGVSIMYLVKIRKKRKGEKETGWISCSPH